MQQTTCTPDQARGRLLATAVQAGRRLLPRGQVVGRDEIGMLNAAGVQEVEVIKVGVHDMLAAAATDRLTRALAGDGLNHMPAHLGGGRVCAARPGVLRIDAATTTAVMASQDRFSLATLPALTAVPRGTECAWVTTRHIIHPTTAARSLAACLPPLELLPPRRELLGRVVRPFESLTSVGREIEALFVALGKTLGLPGGIVNPLPPLAVEVRLVTAASEVDLALAAATARPVLVPPGVRGPGWRAGINGDTIVVACPPLPGELHTHGSLGRLLAALHAGLALDSRLQATAWQAAPLDLGDAT